MASKSASRGVVQTDYAMCGCSIQRHFNVTGSVREGGTGGYHEARFSIISPRWLAGAKPEICGSEWPAIDPQTGEIAEERSRLSPI